MYRVPVQNPAADRSAAGIFIYPRGNLNEIQDTGRAFQSAPERWRDVLTDASAIDAGAELERCGML